jgi:predicted DsbA family dithiol-disulfide isomerase
VIVDVWFSYLCPLSYMHLFTIHHVKQVYGPRVDVRWHPYGWQLASAPQTRDDYQRRSSLWDTLFLPAAAERGFNLRKPLFYPKTDKALELMVYADRVGAFDAVHRAIFEAVFEHSLDISDLDVLSDVGDACGLDNGVVRGILQSGIYEAEVIRRRAFSRVDGVQGLPHTKITRSENARGGAPSSVVLKGLAPFRHFHMAVTELFPDGFQSTPKALNGRATSIQMRRQ